MTISGHGEEKEEIALSGVEFHSPEYIYVVNISCQMFFSTYF